MTEGSNRGGLVETMETGEKEKNFVIERESNKSGFLSKIYIKMNVATPMERTKASVPQRTVIKPPFGKQKDRQR